MTNSHKPGTPPRWTHVAEKKTLGVVMIVRNEAHNLSALFETIADVADEVVVVDTGSTDDTVGVCKKWGVKVVHDRWRNDFSRARNRSIGAARSRYLLWLDGDDRLPVSTQEELKCLRDEVLPNIHDQAFLFQVHNLNAAGDVIDVFMQTRLFPRRPGVRFQNSIHEQVTESLKGIGVELVRTELSVEHTGYADAAVVRGKAIRNEVLLREVLKKDPGNIPHLIHMAQTLAGLGRFREAEIAISDAIGPINLSTSEASLVAELYTLRAGYRIAIANKLGAVYDLETAIDLWPAWGIPYAALAEIYMNDQKWDAAWTMLEGARAASFVPGIVGFPLARAQSNVEWFAGNVLHRRGSSEEAVACLRRAVTTDLRNLGARIELGQVLLEREEYADALAVLEPAGEDSAAVPHFVDVSAAIGLARAMTGDEAGAGACLAPLLDVFAAELGGADDVNPIQLAEVMIRSGYGNAAKNMITLFQKTAAAA